MNRNANLVVCGGDQVFGQVAPMYLYQITHWIECFSSKIVFSVELSVPLVDYLDRLKFSFIGEDMCKINRSVRFEGRECFTE